MTDPAGASSPAPAGGAVSGRAKRLSVIAASYNRPDLVRTLLQALAEQTVSPDEFEVIVIDDGSRVPVADSLAGLSTPFELRVLRQANTGAPAARHQGILEARGDIVVIVDDDMDLEPDFLAQHSAAHEGGAEVVLGNILPSPSLQRMPLFERFHARQLVQLTRNLVAGRVELRGAHMCTGNMSVRRALYLKVGGFQLDMRRSEDRELGIRLEKAGARFAFAPAAKTIHNSDHSSLDVWLERAFLYGIWDARMGEKHGEIDNAQPWRFLYLVSPLSRPLLLSVVLWPRLGRLLARAVMYMAAKLDDLGAERAALAGTTLAYGLEYFRGARTEAGSVVAAIRRMAHYHRQHRGPRRSPDRAPRRAGGAQ